MSINSVWSTDVDRPLWFAFPRVCDYVNWPTSATLLEEPFPSERDFAPALQNAGSLTLAMPTTNEYVELEAEKVPKTEGAGKQMQTIHCYWGKKW